MSVAQRDKLARQGIINTLGVTDDKAAAIAALEAVNERLAWDTALQQSLREKYDDLSRLTASSAKKASLGPVPVPIRTGTPEQYNPYAAFDPYKLLWQYGAEQLRAVLARLTQRDLREAVGIVETRNQDAKGPRGSKADMIEYILQHVAGSGY